VNHSLKIDTSAQSFSEPFTENSTKLSDLHYKFTLGPHHVTKYGRHPIYGRGD